VIYLDHHAATPIEPAAIAAMREAEARAWANPSSVHSAGRAARSVLETARGKVAKSIECDSADLILTGGGTEACNLGVLGLLGEACGPVVTTRLEHPAVAAAVAATGREVRWLDWAPGSREDDTVDTLKHLLDPKPKLVAIQWVNHETGTLWPLVPLANACRQAGVPLFVDATQAWGKLPFDAPQIGATAVAIAAHKAGGPAGAGALWVARGTELHARMLGGGQERGRRAGSPDPVTHAGFGAAAEGIPDRLADHGRLTGLRDQLEKAAVALGGIVNGGEGPRVGTVTNVSFRGRTGAALVAAMDLEGVCCSSGAACSSGLNEASPVLRAMYPEQPWRASSALRFSLGPQVSEIDVESAIAALEKVLSRPPA